MILAVSSPVCRCKVSAANTLLSWGEVQCYASACVCVLVQCMGHGQKFDSIQKYEKRPFEVTMSSTYCVTVYHKFTLYYDKRPVKLSTHIYLRRFAYTKCTPQNKFVRKEDGSLVRVCVVRMFVIEQATAFHLKHRSTQGYKTFEDQLTINSKRFTVGSDLQVPINKKWLHE